MTEAQGVSLLSTAGLSAAGLCLAGLWRIGLSPAASTAGLGLLSAAIWGTSDFVGGVAAQRIRSSAVVALSHSLSLVILIALALGSGAAFPDRASALYGLASGAACGTGVIVLYRALALGAMGLTASVSGVLAAALPVVFALVTEGLPRPRQWIGFLVAAAAIWMVAAGPAAVQGSGGSAAGGKWWAEGPALGAVAGVSFGCLFILLKLAGRGGVLWPLAFSRLSSASLAMVVAVSGMRRVAGAAGAAEMAPPVAPGAAPVVERRAQGGRGTSGVGWGVLGLTAIAGVFDVAGNSFYTMATRIGRLDIAAVLSSLYPASTIVLAAVILKERTTRTQTAGMVLAMVAVVLISG